MKASAEPGAAPARFATVDVFCQAAFRGNPVAVVLGADGLDDTEMQHIAAWTRLSETTFVLRPTTPNADWRLRIFDPIHELPFAGHPSIGTAHALRDAGLVAITAGRDLTFTQECAAGILPVHFSADGTIWVRTPTAHLRPAPDADTIRAALGTTSLASDPVVADLGAVWIVAELADPSAVAALTPDHAAVAAAAQTAAADGITVFAPGGPDGTRYTVRTFAPGIGIDEDPVCGSGNAAIAAALAARGAHGPPNWIAAQGGELGRDGRVHVRIDDDAGIWIGGHCVTTVTGTIRLR